MITLHPFDDLLSMDVIRNLDAFDRLEAEALRGAPVTSLALWADWRAIEGVRVASWIVRRAATGLPVALIALVNTGQSGVASAAMVARDHGTYRRELVAIARRIRDGMPSYCADLGINRIEARAWSDHPRASEFLKLVGFRHEADMPGFGPGGALTFRQFAWTPTT